MVERGLYLPPTPDDVAADLAAIGPPSLPPPWDLLVAEAGQHEPTTCATCAPIMACPAWARGAARATTHQALLPLSSAGAR